MREVFVSEMVLWHEMEQRLFRVGKTAFSILRRLDAVVSSVVGRLDVERSSIFCASDQIQKRSRWE
jgi:hypothetical protein